MDVTAQELRTVAIVGTGAYAQGLANLLERTYAWRFFSVSLASRRLKVGEEVVLPRLPNVPVRSMDTVFQTANVVVLAIPCHQHQTFAEKYRSLLAGKVVLDVSNTSPPSLWNDLTELCSLFFLGGRCAASFPSETRAKGTTTHHDRKTSGKQCDCTSRNGKATPGPQTTVELTEPCLAIQDSAKNFKLEMPFEIYPDVLDNPVDLKGEDDEHPAMSDLESQQDFAICSKPVTQAESKKGPGADDMETDLSIDWYPVVQEADLSSAEKLQIHMGQRVSVVKGLNDLSAFSMLYCKHVRPGLFQSTLSSDSLAALDLVRQFCSHAGIETTVISRLQHARCQENVQEQLLGSWRLPCLFALMSVLVCELYGLAYFVLVQGEEWYHVFLMIFNKSCAWTSTTLLAVTYLPGVVVTLYMKVFPNAQISRGMKRWLKSRKQLGLLALLFCILHILICCMTMGVAYYPQLYIPETVLVPAIAGVPLNPQGLQAEGTIPQGLSVSIDSSSVGQSNSSDVLVVVQQTQAVGFASQFRGMVEASLLVGLLSSTLLVIMGIASLPDVSRWLSKRDCRFVQHHMGWTAFFLATLHVILIGVRFWSPMTEWVEGLWPPITLLASLLPMLVLCLKLVSWLAELPWERLRGKRPGKCSTIPRFVSYV